MAAILTTSRPARQSIRHPLGRGVDQRPWQPLRRLHTSYFTALGRSTHLADWPAVMPAPVDWCSLLPL